MGETTIDKHGFKISVATAIIVILFLFGIAFQFATWKAEMCAEHKEFDDRITHLGDKVIGMRADISTLNEKANNRDIDIATINTKLANIETLLVEIKVDLKSKT